MIGVYLLVAVHGLIQHDGEICSVYQSPDLIYGQVSQVWMIHSLMWASHTGYEACVWKTQPIRPDPAAGICVMGLIAETQDFSYWCHTAMLS